MANPIKSNLRSLFLLILFISVSHSSSHSAPFRQDRESFKEYAAFPLKAVIAGYRAAFKNDLRSICPMEPSCSAYGLKAVEKYGALLGYFKTVDRLNRCGHDIAIYSTIRAGDRLKLHDSPE